MVAYLKGAFPRATLGLKPRGYLLLKGTGDIPGRTTGRLDNQEFGETQGMKEARRVKVFQDRIF